ncbi:hypothetical protein LCGC14_0535640 [marine sediment metagenome]|uniref:Chromosomal replication initiator DnaA C-terminal domain-containing protein n=1 Tax=marine sediment metagenome TaxID=412755 RepID=A0A0F9RUF1_9ZZZZ
MNIEALSDIGERNQPVTMGLIIGTVAAVFVVDTSALIGRGRTAEVAQARQAAMYVMSMTDKYTLAAIGGSLGGRSPATVSHGFQVIAKSIKRQITLRNKIKEVQGILSRGLDRTA